MIPAEFVEGDIPFELQALQRKDRNAIVGHWEEIKSVSDSVEPILAKMGVGLIKRKARAAATIRTHISTTDGTQFHYKTFYPLHITKEVSFPADGTVVSIKDSDTCDWKSEARVRDGCVIQKRVGSKGTWWDTRCVLERHPTGATNEQPVLLNRWVLITPNNEKLVANSYFKLSNK